MTVPTTILGNLERQWIDSCIICFRWWSLVHKHADYTSKQLQGRSGEISHVQLYVIAIADVTSEIHALHDHLTLTHIHLTHILVYISHFMVLAFILKVGKYRMMVHDCVKAAKCITHSMSSATVVKSSRPQGFTRGVSVIPPPPPPPEF